MIGIGITTRNRSEVLAWSLKHFKAFEPELPYTLVIVDDNSDDNQRVSNQEHCEGYQYIYNEERKGIAGSKNVCLKNLQSADHVFLFDDDCFPQCSKWDIPFRQLLELGIEHSSHCLELPKEHGQQISDPVGELKDASSFFSVSMSQGMCLYFSRRCLDSIGLYDEKYGIYGFEHSDMSLRARKLGFCGNQKYEYIVPKESIKYLFSLDFDHGWFHRETLFGKIPFLFTTSLAGENVDSYVKISGQHFSSKKH